MYINHQLARRRSRHCVLVDEIDDLSDRVLAFAVPHGFHHTLEEANDGGISEPGILNFLPEDVKEAEREVLIMNLILAYVEVSVSLLDGQGPVVEVILVDFENVRRVFGEFKAISLALLPALVQGCIEELRPGSEKCFVDLEIGLFVGSAHGNAAHFTTKTDSVRARCVLRM